MRLRHRERVLFVVTLAVVAGALFYWFSEPMVQTIAENRDEKEDLQRTKKIRETILANQERWETAFKEIQGRLKRYPKTADISARLLQMLQNTADSYNLDLLRIEPGSENDKGPFYQLAINCRWQGNMEELIRFLLAIQNKGMTLDTRSLTITPTSQHDPYLQGSFTVVVAYNRGKPELPEESSEQHAPGAASKQASRSVSRTR